LAGKGKKRRKLDPASRPSTPGKSAQDEGGGFIDDAGGFVDDGGGFMPEGEGGFVEAEGFLPDVEGGFTPDESGPSTPAAGGPSTRRIPLRLIPTLLSILELPSDEDVLEVFRSSASGWQEEDTEDTGGLSRRRKREEEAGVERKDFRAVCAALMGPDDGEAEGDAGISEEQDDDAYQDSEDASESALSSLSSDSEYVGEGRRERGDAPPGRPTRRSKRALLVDTGPVKLSSRQREVVKDIWEMLKPDAAGRGANILGRDEVKKWAMDLGEMWSGDEVS
jgi:hypothetical protein